ncbi:tail fiber domain-containing protein [Shewanella sp. Scap07]|uniref:tail fiber domain-containing protein n=1 Tax=Shewanella sp. Scap07 TaxID=2589987 RepID=UPI0015BF7A3F|nr:tail fiber domain-containing protein [Shewanella sp. Scap07]QLE86079.1 tail fiber domain-containing protein [Shewanella sp. Scap07]
MNYIKLGALTLLPLTLAISSTTLADQVILDDLIINGSNCVGQDCVNGESFGFDTIRLKENNVRIKFQDTSASASFPSNDWQLTANDSSNGGANKFSIDDIDGGRVPFTVEAGSPNHALYLDSSGNVGLGTNTPLVELHIKSGDSPTLRLEQDGSSGFTPQIWDVASNETNFFIRDATNGSSLPFRIRPGAPQNSLYIDTDGDIGLGDASPDAALDIESGDLLVTNGKITANYNHAGWDPTGTDTLLALNNTNAASIHAQPIVMSNKGSNFVTYSNTDNNTQWHIGNRSPDNTFTLSTNADGTAQIVLTVDGSGNLKMKGDVTANNVLLTSDVNKKENFVNVDSSSVLQALAKLSISTWNYKSQNTDNVHMGPMAQQFYQLFGLGDSDKHISAVDSAGVSLAASKALYELTMEKDAQIKALEARLAKLEAQK